MKTSSAPPSRDETDRWPGIKIDILRDYGAVFSEVLSKRPGLHHVYVEVFGGPGVRLEPFRGSFVPGNPLSALAVRPPFKEYFFVDLDGGRAEALRRLAGDRPDVHVLEGDCNRVLLDEIFPRVREEDYRRGLCVLDPRGLYLEWPVLAAVGRMQTLEIFFELPTKEIDRRVLERDRAGLPVALHPMDAMWGDDSWRALALPAEKRIDGGAPAKISLEAIVEDFHRRLVEEAGFKFVPKPMPRVDASGEIAGHLFFASHNVLGGKIVESLFERNAQRPPGS
jgi:three-Cys-motif partner protein